jgi:prophage tail gpP-like protein
VSERTTGAPFEPWILEPGAACEILLDGELVLTGYIDTYSPTFDASSHGVAISGRSRTADFIDSSAIVPGGQFKQLSLWEIAQRLAAPFGLVVDALASIGGPLADVQIQQGETCYAVLERLCRMQGLLVCDGPAGILTLTRVGSRGAAGALVQGQNILSAGAQLDASQRFSEYTVKGQRANTDDRVDENFVGPPEPPGGARLGRPRVAAGSASGAGATVRACIGAALDASVGRYRPWLLTAETQADDATCQRRAEWEARRRAGHATRATVVVAGWRQTPGGPLWDTNLLVPVIAPWLGIDRVLLISSLEFRKDDGGSTTAMELTLPDAFATEGEAVPGDTTASGGAPSGGGDLWSSGQVKGVVERAGGIVL